MATEFTKDNAKFGTLILRTELGSLGLAVIGKLYPHPNELIDEKRIKVKVLESNPIWNDSLGDAFWSTVFSPLCSGVNLT